MSKPRAHNGTVNIESATSTPEHVKVSARVPVTLANQLVALADANRRSIGGELRIAVQAYVGDTRKARRMRREAG